MRLRILILLTFCCYGAKLFAQVPYCTLLYQPFAGETGINPLTSLSWNAVGNATSYDVMCGTTNPPTTVVANTASTFYYFTSPLSYNTTYYWYVVPKNANGTAVGCASATRSFTVQDVPLPCAVHVSPANGAQNMSATGTVLKWARVDRATSYSISYGPDSPYNMPMAFSTYALAPDTSVTLTSLLYNTKYSWRVLPYNIAIYGTTCNQMAISSFTTTAPPANCTYQYERPCASGTPQITRFKLKGENGVLDILTQNVCYANGPYLDTTDHPFVVNLVAGKSYWGRLLGLSNEASIWLDANDDGIFDYSERLVNNIKMAQNLGINPNPGGYINLYIPPGTPVGNHRLRVRTVEGPTYRNDLPIDACANYQYGETEDYKVNIVAIGSPYTVASYIPDGACLPDINITVDPPSNNTNSTIPIVDTNNAIIAMLSPNGNNLGLVTISYYKHGGAVRSDPQGIYYLGRNITVKPQRQPTTPWGLRFYYQAAELNDLIAQPGSGVSSAANLKMTKNGDACRTAVNLPGSLHTPVGSGLAGADGYLDFAGLTGIMSSFYLHGGATPVPLTLIGFSAQKTMDEKYLLQWSTAQEVNTGFFTVEYSTDGRNFTSAGQVPAAGNSSTLRNYQFTGNRLLAGVNYFRLKTTDVDGRVHYSAIITLLNNQTGFELIGIAPNPVTQEVLKLSVAANRSINMEIMIVDMTGRIVAKQRHHVQSGVNTIAVNVSTLAKGSYQLNGVMAAGKTNTVKFVIP